MSEVAVPPQVSAARSAGEQRALDRSLVHGLAWTGAAKWGVQALSWAGTVVVARLLSPSDYGLVGMATVYLGFVLLVNEQGLTAAIIQRRDLDEERIAKLGGLAVLVGFALLGLSVALAAPVAIFFGEQATRWIIIVLSLSFLT